MENTSNHYPENNPDFKKEQQTIKHRLQSSGTKDWYDFQNEELKNESPMRHPEQDRNPAYHLPYDFDEE